MISRIVITIHEKIDMQMHRLIILCFLLTSTAAAAAAAAADYDDPNYISINCGGAAPATSLTGRRWSGDAAPEGSSTVSTVKGDLIAAVNAVPYRTARVSRSRFSYSFRISPGQKFIRLHFNPVSYHGFQSFNDFFSVEAGPFMLLANFSASITARALSVNVLAKEFCIIVQGNQALNIVFSPETSRSKYNYAFINGIEIISVPSTISYCHGGNNGINVLGQKSVIYVDNSTVLERVYHQNMKLGSVLDDIGGMFGMWKDAKTSDLSWRVPVDVGFRYLVRIHLCEIGLGLRMDFTLLIDNIIALTSADVLQKGGNQSSLWYNYMVMVEGQKQEGKSRICISLNSQQEFMNGHWPLEGFEVFKLSNPDRSLASPNPLPPRGDSPSYTIQTLLYFLLGRRNAIATVFFSVICMVNIIVHLLHKMWEADLPEEENKPSDSAKRHCRRFSLAEIQSATENFHGSYILGKGGFGNVYKGFIDSGREIVAIKRSKPDSNQGEHQFWMEVETLSKLRHVNLVSLIGYCIEKREMMLVYEFMPCGTLADHLYKLARKGNVFYHLSWKQRLKICIGAGRALEYLHSGRGIMHRDVKPSNILLDEKFVAKVSDFGLAKTGIGSESQSQDTTNLRGTFGYIDPDYFRTRKLTTKSDTYSFGVVLLEVLCGRQAVEPWNEEEKRSLTMWAIDKISKGQVDDIVATSLREEISPDSLKTFVKVAERCLQDKPKKRPAIGHVVIELELALQQQEKVESLAANEGARDEDVISCTDKSQKEDVNILVPNEEKSAANDLPGNDRTIISVDLRPTTSSFKGQTVTSLPREQINSTMINSSKKDGRKSMMLKISRILWPWDAFRKTRKPSNTTEMVGITASAPVSRRTNNSEGNLISNKRISGMTLSPTLKIFTSEEVKIATRNFSEDTVLGVGSFGKVYKGWIHEEFDAKKQSGSAVAIKKLNHESMQGFKEWQSEVNFLGRLSHPNLVKLLGYGWDDEVLFLVYEYMPRGTLADHLYKLAKKSNDLCPLSWTQRLKICIDVGRALDHLQTGQGIIHCRVKASNILLDEKLRAKVSDFSVAVAGSGSESQTQDSISLIGTSGYVDPNYFSTRKLTTKGDIYSFGVMLLEVLCGRPAVEPSNEQDKRSLTMWAMDNISKGQFDDIVAPSMRGEILPDSLKTFVKVAERCLHDDPKKRPATARIIAKLVLAFQQQEKPESLPPKEKTSAEDFSTSTSQKDNINFMVPNEKINVADDVSPSQAEQILPQPNFRVFTVSELRDATRNFGSDSVLGVGGFGTVYKGWINDKSSGRTVIAVKRLNAESTQGFEEWQSEINFLGRHSHPNLVRLLGFGWEGRDQLLVYEFMAKGSLENHLFRSKGFKLLCRPTQLRVISDWDKDIFSCIVRLDSLRFEFVWLGASSVQPLPWDIRLKVLTGAARGMAFLHRSEQKVIHRDFKTANILLDESYHAKISDFGLAKLGPAADNSHVTTQIMGTYGYAAPEYIATGHLYVKSDVYGFGVVLLEMLTGLQALDTSRPSGQHSLVDWMKPHLSNSRKIKHFIDKRLEGNYPSKSAIQMAQLALHCLQPDPRKRPSMQEVVEKLEIIALLEYKPINRRVRFSH